MTDGKMHSKRKVFGKSDICLILALLIAALIFLFIRPSSDVERECLVMLDGITVKTVHLDKNQIFTVPERPDVIFEVKNGAVGFQLSNCPDKICVKTGFIKATGQSAACLPNGLALRIEAKDGIGPLDADTVTN